MKFYDATTEDAVVQEVWRICGATANTYTLKQVTARVNQALDRFFYLALSENGDWQFDDSNYTDFPIGTTNIVSGQQDYSFPAELLNVTKVLAKDSTGNWRELIPVDQNEPLARNIWELPTSNSGAATRYDIFSNSIFLDPIPNYSSSNGLKVVYGRNASKFVSTDTTKEPGIPSLFHPYLCRHAALSFLIEKKLPQLTSVSQQVLIDEEAIKDFIANRNETKKTKIRPSYRDPR